MMTTKGNLSYFENLNIYRQRSSCYVGWYNRLYNTVQSILTFIIVLKTSYSWTDIYPRFNNYAYNASIPW